MRKKSSFSEENVLLSSNAKLSEYLRQNPRLPKKMKTLKSKCVNPTVRTVGQLSCTGKQLPTIFGSQDVFKGESGREESDPMTHMDNRPWTTLDRNFSQNRSPICSPRRTLLDPRDYSLRERSWSKICDKSNPFCLVSDTDHQTELLSENEPQTVSATPTLNPHVGQSVSVNRKTSENGVQVNMFHCKECRRHIKYGKHFINETSCTESESESNFLSNCTTCKRNEDMNSPNVRGGDGEENNERNDCSMKCNMSPQDYTLCDRDKPLDCSTLTPRTELLSVDGDIPHGDNISHMVTFSQMIGGKKIWVLDIKFITIALLTVSTMLYLTQFSYFGATISSINFYLRNLMLQKETEERFSVYEWVSYMLFNVHEYVKPRPLVSYLF